MAAQQEHVIQLCEGLLGERYFRINATQAADQADVLALDSATPTATRTLQAMADTSAGAPQRPSLPPVPEPPGPASLVGSEMVDCARTVRVSLDQRRPRIENAEWPRSARSGQLPTSRYIEMTRSVTPAGDAGRHPQLTGDPTMPATRLRIFLSSVQGEFAQVRRDLKAFLLGDAVLRRFVADVFLFEDLPARDQRADAAYLEQVERCDVYLGLFGYEYGSHDGAGVSPTEREYDHATQRRKTRLVFV